MTSFLLRAAIRNNAFWCDAVCKAQGSPGEFTSTLWFHRRDTPPFYPDVITLTETDGEAVEAIVTVINSEKRDWAVKDSYSALDLAPLGFTMLFEAEWIGMWRPTLTPSPFTWKRMENAADLARWEAEWAKANGPVTQTIFTEPLLHNPEIAFLLGFEHDQPVGGGILNHHGGVVGHSNLFAGGGRVEAIRRGMIAQAAELYPGEPLVGYERGDDLDEALRTGFELLGPLRVWLKEA
ncbi:hypothetical protein FHX08_000374 [Rhizobium sp. BK529]|uniref:hypothetical protein n=1 Tax=unclassified Rhizobium TaxID=2613769 RepID=UPI0010462F0A|nr:MULTISPECIES: hypothetical protein [unclassified Rhizobium]MBB3590030.1 hypothetical protein [Rhizobium sp. BK529]TCS04727.1 hypothetical protein EV281_103403 [Rhizobium sp. BK418]